MAKQDLIQILGEAVTVGELIDAMDELQGGVAQFLAARQGKPLAAIVLIHGDDTSAYLSALHQRGRDLALLRDQQTSSVAVPESSVSQMYIQ